MQFLFFLISSASWWWVIPCLAAAFGYSWLLYRRDRHFEKNTKRLLALLRGSLVFLLCFLLMNPVFKSIGKRIEKPVIVFLQDNSSSLLDSKFANSYRKEYTEKQQELFDRLSADYTLRVYHFGDDLRENGTTDFSRKRTDISNALNVISDAYANQNVGAVILASDGIYNKGQSPLYTAEKIQAPIYTIAMGDTTPQRDLVLKNVVYNRIAFLGNNFNINVQVSAFAAKNETSLLTVKDEGKTVFSKTLTIDQADYFISVPVTLNADKKGVKKLQLSVSPLKNEITALNNSKTIYIEVLEGKQKIVMVALAPHPDLSAIKQSVESNQNYSVDIQMADRFDPAQLKNYQLLILHQLPSSSNATTEILNTANRLALPVWYILGSDTYLDLFNRTGSGLTILNSKANPNEALPALNTDFYAFTLSDQAKEEIRKFPPLSAAFGTYRTSGNFNTLLTQRIGAVTTDQPLLGFGTSGAAKTGILAGEGIWRWRLQNFQSAGNHEAINELMSKTIQYLAARDDKRRFRVTQPKNYFDETEEILFNAELYNDSYELVNQPDVSMELKQADKKYTYSFSRTGEAYSLNAGILPPGDYTWDAATSLGKENFKMNGRFTIAEINAEQQQTTADHQLLYALSLRSSGQMVYSAEMDRLPELLKAREDIKTVSYEQKKFEELVNLRWFFFVLLALVSVEWFIRKRSGLY